MFSPVIPAFFVGGQASDEVLFRAGFVDGETFVGQYPLGNMLIKSSDLSFLCGNKNEEFVAPKPSIACWTASLNEKKAVFGQNLDFGVFTARFVPQGRYVRDLGFLSVTDRKIDWFLKINPDVITVAPKENNILAQAGKPVKYSFVVDSKIDGLMGGFVIKTTQGIFRKENVEIKKVIFGKGENVFVNQFKSDVFGTAKVTITPFVELYDMGQGFTGEDTGFCVVNRKNVKLCVPKRSVSINAQPVSFDFNVVPSNVELNKDISTRCYVQNDCSQGFICVKNICEFGQQRFNILQWFNTFLLKLRVVLGFG